MSPTPTVTTASISRAVVPAAGLGTRLRPLTHAIPKELLPIGRKPVLAYVLEELCAAGITHALFVVSERKPQIRSYFGDVYVADNDLPPLQCDYVIQSEQRGSGDAVLCAESWVGDEPFVVAFGDCLIEAQEPGGPLRRLIDTHLGHGAAATVLVESVERSKVSRYGVVAPVDSLPQEPQEPFAIAGVVEKPTVAEAPSNLVVAARWALQPSIFGALRRCAVDTRGELNIPDAARQLMPFSSCWAVPLRNGEARRDIGNMESFLTQFVRAALQDPECGAALRRIVRTELPAEE
jgi:UTP--glucose-1-phosphate uridylyltransferase